MIVIGIEIVDACSSGFFNLNLLHYIMCMLMVRGIHFFFSPVFIDVEVIPGREYGPLYCSHRLYPTWVCVGGKLTHERSDGRIDCFQDACDTVTQ